LRSLFRFNRQEEKDAMNRKHIDLEIQGGIIRRFTDLVLTTQGRSLWTVFSCPA
jgi:hypothetical protein